MLLIQKPFEYDKVLLVHNGAVGDFFILWPAIWTLSQSAPHAQKLWAGASDRLPWLVPLGFSPCSPSLRQAITRWYDSTIPQELSSCLIIWPVLASPPPVGPSPNLWVLPGVNGLGDGSCRRAYVDGLTSKGLAARNDWARAFQRLFAGDRCPGKTILLFPGAGHQAKTWPLVKFFALAEGLAGQGWQPKFVLGPNEIESGLAVAPWPLICPDDLGGLQKELLRAKAVVGGDTGPMHLAAMLGLPGVGLFGPTSPRQWGPAGMNALSLGLGCSPCASTCSDLRCPSPRCLEDLPVEKVIESLAAVL